MPRATPIYKQIMDDIKEKVRSGELRPGDKLPTLEELKAYYRCSGEPVKSALRTLSMTGHTVGYQGRGHYIAPGPDMPGLGRPYPEARGSTSDPRGAGASGA